MRARGVDVTQPAMFAARGPLTAADGVLVVSSDGTEDSCQRLKSFLEADTSAFEFGEAGLCKLIAGDAANGTGKLDRGPKVFVKALDSEAGGGRVLLAFYSNPAVFRSILARRDGGDHLLSQDGFAEAYRTMTQGQRPAAWAFARQPGLAPFAPSAASLTFADADPELVPDDVRRKGQAALAAAVVEELGYQADSGQISGEGIAELAADISGSANFVAGARSARLSLWLAPSVLYSRNLSGLLSAKASPAMSAIGGGSSAGLSLTAQQLMEFVAFADHAFPGTLAAFLFRGKEGSLGAQATIFETLLGEVMTLQSVNGIDTRLVGFQSRIPNTVVRISISEPEARLVVRRIQVSEQKRRDVALLNAALGQEVDAILPLERARDLLRAGAVSKASVPGAFAHIESATLDVAAFEAAVADDPLNSGCWPDVRAVVATCSSDRRFHYLQPPLNDDDVRLRVEEGQDAAAIRKSLLEDQRFRAVALYDPATRMLWVASDRDVLAQHFGRTSDPSPAGKAWVKMSVQPDSLYTQMQAQGFDEDSEDATLAQTAELAKRLSVYDHILLSAESLGEKRGTRIDLELTR
jgi:hypothetical protein